MQLLSSANCCRPSRSAAARCSIAPAPGAMRSRRARRPWSSCARTCCRAAAKPRAWRSRGEILDRYAELTIGPRIAFFEALATRFGPDRERLERRDRGLAARARPTRPPPRCIAAAESRRQELFRRLNLAPGGTAGAGRHARATARRDGASRRPRRRRCRFRPPVLVLVQPRLPGAAAHRLVDAGDHPGEDHPLRGGAPHPRLGRPAPPHRSARPPLLRVLPSGADRRSADLRRGRADARHPDRDRADPRPASAS